MDTRERNLEITDATPLAGRPSGRRSFARLPLAGRTFARLPFGRAARRPVSRQARAVTAAAGLAALFMASGLPAAPEGDQQACPPPPTGSQSLTKIGEIKSDGGRLQAVIKVVSGGRCLPGQTQKVMLRYFAGYNPGDKSQEWPDPANVGVGGPGPTLRAKLGDVVNITFLNQVRVGDFAGTLDSGDDGSGNGCDRATNATTGDKNWYPADDKYPNCFHASSTANLHFHGTHVSPSTTGDNVLIGVRPNEKVTERDVNGPFQQVFQHCETRQEPQKWGDLPRSWRDYQETQLKQYDDTAPYVGPGRSPSGHGLPRDLQLWPQNQQAIDHGLWPQWYSGSYPYCFQLPREAGEKSGLRMAQAPGTHWYHSHKHGSTALNLFNGLAGAFIIADDSAEGYDGKLKAFYKDKLEEKVLVLQQLTPVVNMLSAASNLSAPSMLVNGQLAPTITMRPGEVQLWRIVNGSVQGFVKASFTPAGASGITFRQTAQDGVQLAWENYSKPENGTQAIELAPANRVDLLVQAPSTAGPYTLQQGKTALLNISVSGDAVSPPGFPSKAGDYPKLPDFLHDVDAATIRVRRNLVYGSRSPANPTPRKLLQFTIDGKQFQDQVIDQVMRVDTAEEWTVYNTDTLSPPGGIKHPFHIHVNPFQIVEVFDPGAAKEEDRLKTCAKDCVWWDTFAIPKPAKLASGTCPVPLLSGGQCPGYFKMRTRFVDFTGQYVQHCHILAHEDRGMMQLIEVVADRTPLKHH